MLFLITEPQSSEFIRLFCSSNSSEPDKKITSRDFFLSLVCYSVNKNDTFLLFFAYLKPGSSDGKYFALGKSKILHTKDQRLEVRDWLDLPCIVPVWLFPRPSRSSLACKEHCGQCGTGVLLDIRKVTEIKTKESTLTTFEMGVFVSHHDDNIQNYHGPFSHSSFSFSLHFLHSANFTEPLSR